MRASHPTAASDARGAGVADRRHRTPRAAHGLAVLGAALLAAHAHGGTVAERELLVRNQLDMARPGEWVTVTLSDLGIEPGMETRIRSVAVTDGQGRRYEAQLDPFCQVPGLSSEVVIELDLRPHETRELTLRFSDAPDVDSPARCTVTVDGESIEVRTPEFVAPMRNDGAQGLFVEQPHVPLTGDEEDDAAIDGLLDDAFEDEAGDVDQATGVGEALDSPDVRPPLRDTGFPFCVQGVWGFSPRARLLAWGGRLRAVVTLADEKATWPVAKTNVTRTVRQTFWFPRRDKQFYLDVVTNHREALSEGRFAFAGVRINSLDHEWALNMGQDGRPPFTSPVKIMLSNTRKSIYLEGYQRSSFNHTWAELVGEPGWLALIVDRQGSQFGEATDWGSGRGGLDNTIVFSDPGPIGNSLQPLVKFKDLPTGYRGRIRTAFRFGGADDARPVLQNVAARLNSAVAVLPTASELHPPADAERVRALAKTHDVLIVAPDAVSPSRSALLDRLAARLGGSWYPAGEVLRFFSVMNPDVPPVDLLTVVVGEPGSNPLLDKMNAARHVINAYPLEPRRSAVALFAATHDAGALLFVAGNAEDATDQAIAGLADAVGAASERAPVTLSSYAWTDRMPYPWSGQRPHEGAFRSLAFRNGHAEFLLLLRAGRAIDGLALEPPEGSVCRSVLWTFKSDADGKAGVVPLHDAVTEALPEHLDEDSVVAVWISMAVPADADTGIRHSRARLHYDGGEQEIALETEILAPVLEEQRAIGFYPMGLGKSALQMYYEWDDDTYYRKLPDLLRGRAEFGANSYALDLSGMKITANAAGEVVVDTTDLRRELEAVRSAGCVDLMELRTLNDVWDRRELAKVIAAKGLSDDYEAWEDVIPKVRVALEELGLAGKVTCRHADEIADYERWLAQANLYKRCGARMTVAINGYGVFNKRLGVGTMGLWIPLYNFYLNRWGDPIPDDDPLHFSKQFRDERQAAGEEIWPYVCGPGPYAWSARPRSQARFLVLDTYMKGADGLTYYGGTVWSHALDPAYRETVKAPLFDHDCTFTTLFYPDAASGKLLPSVRAGAFKIGLEDATAVDALRRRVREQGRSADVEKAIATAYAGIALDSSQEEFDTFRRTLSGLW